MAEPAVRFPGAQKRFPNLPAFAMEHLGYELQAAEDDYVIAADDPELRLGPRSPLSAHGPVPLSAKNRHKLSGILMSNLPRQMNQYYQSNQLKINWNVSEDSELARAYQLQTDVTVAQPDDVRRILRDRVLPFMIDEIKAVSACPVTLDVNRQQAYITFAKFGLLSNKHESTIIS